MARCSETMDTEAPDRNRLPIVRRLQLSTGRPPAEEIDILRSEIHRRLTKLQDLLDPIGMVRRAAWEATPHQTKPARGQECDRRRRIVRRVDEQRFPAVMHPIALHPIAIDRSTHSVSPGDGGRVRRFPLLDLNLLQWTRAKA